MIKTQSYVNLCVCLSCFKLLFLKSYVSTDFDVHRNWMAITYNLPLKDWYYDTTQDGTLDYPPLFASFEFLLARLAHLLGFNSDSELLSLTGSPIRSDVAIIYQKITVILSDCVFYFAVYKLCKSLCTLVSQQHTETNKLKEKKKNNDGQSSSEDVLSKSKSDKQQSIEQITKTEALNNKKSTRQNLADAIYRPETCTSIALLLLFQPGLLLIDHVHFQYNGFLSGILLLSIANIIEGNYLIGGFWFSILLNLKHIYLYCAPAYGTYLLASYCLAKVKDRNRVLSFVTRAGRLGSIVLSVFIVTYLPFADLDTLKQIASRLFPFKRGLTHAYWAPNAWSLYNLADKILAFVYKDSLVVKFDLDSISRTRKVSSTSGLVEEYEHQYLPSVKPLTTFILVGVFTIPIVIKCLMNIGKNEPNLFLKSIALTTFNSFMFGWHVHEKAIISVLIPLIPICHLEPRLWPTFLRLTLAGTYSLFPLLFKPAEYLTKSSLLVAYYLFSRSTASSYDKKHYSKYYQLLDNAYLLILILNEFYMTFIFEHTRLNKFEFLPLMSTSSLSALGIALSYLELSFNLVCKS